MLNDALKALKEKGLSADRFLDFLESTGIDCSRCDTAGRVNTAAQKILAIPGNTIYFDDCLKMLNILREAGFRTFELQKKLMELLGYKYVDTYSDMRIGDRSRHDDFSNAEDLAQYVFENYPLLGEHQFSDREKEMLLVEATAVFNKLLSGKTGITMREKTVLTLEMILLTRYDENAADDEISEERRFWKTIFRQLGLIEKDDKEIYKLSVKIRPVISEVFHYHHRYLGNPKTSSKFKVPYTPMRLHALYPTESIYTLFNILIDYYGSELGSQYVENDDRTYKKLAKSISEKQNGNRYLSEEDKVRVRSDKMHSGLCALFNDRSSYASHLCEKIIKKTDALLRGDRNRIVDPETSRWDELLIKWFNENSLEERSRFRSQCRTSERVITRSESIRAAYTLTDGKLSIAFPAIRLGEKADSAPEVSVYSGSRVILTRTLRCYGNEITTVRAFELPLDEIIASGADFGNGFDVRVCIDFKCPGFKNYESSDVLKRKYIIFNENGNEISCGSVRTNDTISIAYSVGHNLYVDGADNLHRTGKNIQITSFTFLDNTSVLFDGDTVFRGDAAKNKFVAHTSVGNISGIKAVYGGMEYAVYPEPFDVTIEIPEKLTDLHRFQVHNGSNITSLETLCGENRYFTVHCADTGSYSHISVVDFTTGKTEYPLLYSIIEGFNYETDRELYFGNINNCTICLTSLAGRKTITADIDETKDTAAFTLDGVALEADIPIVHCEINGNDVFGGDKYIWHREFSYDSVVCVRTPSGFSAAIQMDGNRHLYSTNGRDFQIGAYSPEGSPASVEAVLELCSNNSQITRHELFTVVYSEMFRNSNESPVLLEKGRVIWQPEGIFIGENDPQLTLTLSDGHNRQLAVMNVSAKNEELDCPALINDGWISCRISITDSDDLFSTEPRVIYDKKLPLGNVDAFRFNGEILHLDYYRCYIDDEKQGAVKQVVRKKLNEFTGYLTKIEFKGYSAPAYDEPEVPCYTAVLKYYNTRTGDYVPYRFGKNGSDGLNPVTLWVMPDGTMRICPQDDPDGCLVLDIQENRISQDDGYPIDDFTFSVLYKENKKYV